MWAVMMVAMMAPSATPPVVRGARRAGGSAVLRFAAGYFAVWIGFSAVATAAQWALDDAGLLSDGAFLSSRMLAGLLVIAIAAWQLGTPKLSCLRRCQSASVDAKGGLLQGLRYGASCLGCCGVLMLLLFVAGVMNMGVMMALALWVAIEKNAPWGVTAARVGAVVLLALGAALLA
jgi:predicted metal-binding membrane protein